MNGTLGPEPPVTWEQVMLFVRSLEASALRNDMTPEQGARLVRLVLEFDRHVIGARNRPHV